MDPLASGPDAPLAPGGLGGLQDMVAQGGPFVVLSIAISVLLTMIAIERGLRVFAFRRALRRLDTTTMQAARLGEIEEARRACTTVPSPVHEVFGAGLDRALGRVRGHAATAMRREHKRSVDELKSYVWLLGSAASLMPFVGLLGTVVGVMESFAAIGASGSGGFGIVSAGLSEALVATAAGLAVALEATVFFNVLQNAIGRAAKDQALLIDELVEILDALGPAVPAEEVGRAKPQQL